MPRTLHSELRQCHGAVELVVVVRPVAGAAEPAQILGNGPMEWAWPLDIVCDHPLMGIAGGRQLESFLLTGTRASCPIDGVIGATDGRSAT